MPWKELFVQIGTGLGDAQASQYDIASLVVRLHIQMPQPSQSVHGLKKPTTQSHPQITRAHVVFTRKETSKHLNRSGDHPINQHVQQKEP